MHTTAQSMLLALTLLAAVPGRAGEAPVLQPGTRVRVTATGLEPRRLVGTLERFSEDVVSVRPQGATAALDIPRQALTRLEVSRGREHGAKAVLIGTALGALAGGLLYNTCDLHHQDDCASVRQNLQSGAILGAPVGLVIGGLLALRGGERWQPVARERVRLGVSPAPRGFTLQASLSF